MDIKIMSLRPRLSLQLLCTWTLLLMGGVVSIASAEEVTPGAGETVAPLYKLTIGGYHFSQGETAIDANLRRSTNFGTLWLGLYNSQQRDEHQARAGWDYTFDQGAVHLTPSLQYASQGYLAGSINIETGDEWFAGAGFGRTNLRPNWNLNFDPNDSYSLTAGRRTSDGQSLALQWVRDNRENPDQRHLHFIYRAPMPERQRLTVDVLYKQGLVDGAPIRKWGTTFTYDWPRFFLRLAYDPKVNFTTENMTRVSVGTRF